MSFLAHAGDRVPQRRACVCGFHEHECNQAAYGNSHEKSGHCCMDVVNRGGHCSGRSPWPLSLHGRQRVGCSGGARELHAGRPALVLGKDLFVIPDPLILLQIDASCLLTTISELTKLFLPSSLGPE